MKAHSLRLRLLLLSGLSITVALLVAGFAIAMMFSNHVERSQRTQLEFQLQRLAALIDPNSATPSITQAMPDPRFGVPAGGIYWQVTDPDTGAMARSRSLWDTTLPYSTVNLHDGESVALRLTDPSGLPLVVLLQRLAFERDGGAADRTLDLVVAETTSGTEVANRAFRADLLRALAMLAVVLFSAAWLQVMLGLAPLNVIKRGIAAIRSGKSRHLEGAFPAEVIPLVAEFNELLDVQERSIAFARERAADLAHGLKTSLTLLMGEADTLRHQGSETAAAAIEALADGMSATVDHQLRLSRLRHRSRSDVQSTDVSSVVARVVAALRRTPPGRDIEWVIAIPPDSCISLDAMDLTELVGVLVENAAKWARKTVSVSVQVNEGGIELILEDDGPGLAFEQAQALGERGRRFDESRPGSGLGLAIAREIVALNGGTLDFSRSQRGGLRVGVSFNNEEFLGTHRAAR